MIKQLKIYLWFLWLQSHRLKVEKPNFILTEIRAGVRSLIVLISHQTLATELKTVLRLMLEGCSLQGEIQAPHPGPPPVWRGREMNRARAMTIDRTFTIVRC